MAQFPIGNRDMRGEENNGRNRWDDHMLPGENDLLRWGLSRQMLAMGDDADYFRLSNSRPPKRGRTGDPGTTLDTAIPVDNPFPIDPALRPTLSQTNGDRDSSIAAPKMDDKVLAGILEIFPDISHQYVLELLAARQPPASNGASNVVDGYVRIKEDLIERILTQDSYPKQEKAKRKLEQTDDGLKKWEVAAAGADNPSYIQRVCDVLGQEFLRVPVTYIRQVMTEKKGLYTAYLTIYRQEMLPDDTDIPAMPCEGETAHFFCFTCIRKSAETQIGLMKWRLQCFDTSGCQENFDRSRLKQTLGHSLMKKLDSLQQEDEVQQAGLEGLECCPFCDFKAICGPVEEDREFHCQNPLCEKVSCRLCNDESHTPKTCQEAKQKKCLPERHTVEEAMSEALIRNCPKCKVKIVRESGCNRMQCSKCGSNMCYICRQDISHDLYNHFGKAPTFCKTYDDHEEDRHEYEVDRAQKTTISEVLSQNPDLTEDDLLIDESTAGKTSKTAPRPKRAHQEFHPAAFPVQFVQHRQSLHADAAPENHIMFNRFDGLPPARREPRNMQDQYAYREFLYQQQRHPRHVPHIPPIPPMPRDPLFDPTEIMSGRQRANDQGWLPKAHRFPPL
ncbi:E3 ubiquitin-protein ligase [Aspergillus affinis]|uniref:E3 ubiquitin-protein ligase n=1 Tax=Aspergillus affinis TaxID=1070780 RepID=UPI0022FF24ED|nr:uncharacterized protein KD926_003188 [Aspergillus affinis]KAI9035619.1 hypothetical protein KD926_003188 [Aspergillus affinis]